MGKKYFYCKEGGEQRKSLKMHFSLYVISIVVTAAQLVACKHIRRVRETHCICESERHVLEILTGDGVTLVEQHFCVLTVSSHSYNKHVLRDLQDCCCRATHESEVASIDVFYRYTPKNGCTVVPCAVN